MAILNPYLNFEGNAREAIEFYQGVFGGELNVSTFGDMGMTEHEGNPIPADGVMHAPAHHHAGLHADGLRQRARHSEGQTPNGHLSLSGDEDELLRGYWDKLADGGRVDVPLEVAPWGDAFGQVEGQVRHQLAGQHRRVLTGLTPAPRRHRPTGRGGARSGCAPRALRRCRA